jgi:hypothetical protein
LLKNREIWGSPVLVFRLLFWATSGVTSVWLSAAEIPGFSAFKTAQPGKQSARRRTAAVREPILIETYWKMRQSLRNS